MNKNPPSQVKTFQESRVFYLNILFHVTTSVVLDKHTFNLIKSAESMKYSPKL